MNRHVPPALVSALALLVGLAACGAPPLTPAELHAPVYLDGELRVEGEFCTDSPEDVTFPVKILFVVDTSGSLQFTDPNTQRSIAVQQVVERHLGNPAVQLGIIGFSGRTRSMTDGFTNDRGKLMEAVELLKEADSVTDYQGALGLAFTVLFEDMANSEPAERARTKYVVVFFSDGTPQPQCSRDGDEGDKFLVCEVPRERLAGVPGDVFTELTAGADYNQPYQILDKVDTIAQLAQEFRVGDLRLHTGFLYDEDEAQIAESAFSLDPEAGEELLRGMASHGNGAFLKFSDGEEISFLSIDFNSIKRPFSVKSFIVSNETALPTEAVPVADSDGDGLSDDDEFEVGTDPLLRDSDDDGFSDLFELRRAGQGHDPTDPQRPAARCEFVSARGRSDVDRDRLTGCEEALLGTDPKLFDSDADGLPDWLEFVYGLDPADDSDASRDLDLDGVRNLAEVRAHTDPAHRAVYVAGSLDRYRYRMDPAGETFDGRKCSVFETRHVGLVTPDRADGDAFGKNRIYAYLGQVPEDQPADFGLYRVACSEARFVPPDFRIPAGGVIRLTGEDFIPSAEFDPEIHCRRPDGSLPE